MTEINPMFLDAISPHWTGKPLQPITFIFHGAPLRTYEAEQNDGRVPIQKLEMLPHLRYTAYGTDGSDTSYFFYNDIDEDFKRVNLTNVDPTKINEQLQYALERVEAKKVTSNFISSFCYWLLNTGDKLDSSFEFDPNFLRVRYGVTRHQTQQIWLERLSNILTRSYIYDLADLAYVAPDGQIFIQCAKIGRGGSTSLSYLQWHIEGSWLRVKKIPYTQSAMVGSIGNFNLPDNLYKIAHRAKTLKQLSSYWEQNTAPAAETLEKKLDFVLSRLL